MRSRTRFTITVLLGVLIGFALAVVVERTAAPILAADHALPQDFKVGRKVGILGMNGTLEITEVQGVWIKGSYSKGDTVWIHTGAAPGFSFKDTAVSSK